MIRKVLSNNDVHWIVVTEKKELYLATFGGGLNKLLFIDEAGKGAFKSYSVLDGLPSDVLLSIREDDKHNLWISTENGVSKFIPGEERLRITMIAVSRSVCVLVKLLQQ